MIDAVFALSLAALTLLSVIAYLLVAHGAETLSKVPPAHVGRLGHTCRHSTNALSLQIV